jgi:hypothetical protein
VVHDEGPSPNMKRLGGTIESFQVRFFHTCLRRVVFLFSSQRPTRALCVVCALCVCVVCVVCRFG